MSFFSFPLFSPSSIAAPVSLAKLAVCNIIHFIHLVIATSEYICWHKQLNQRIESQSESSWRGKKTCLIHLVFHGPVWKAIQMHSQASQVDEWWVMKLLHQLIHCILLVGWVCLLKVAHFQGIKMLIYISVKLANLNKVSKVKRYKRIPSSSGHLSEK